MILSGFRLVVKHQSFKVTKLLLQTKFVGWGVLPVESKIMLRKVFVISKENPIKKYGALNEKSLIDVKSAFCDYFECVH